MQSTSTQTLHEILALLASQADNFVEALTEIASYRSAHDEIARSMKALAGASLELEQHRPEPLEQLMVFHPSDNVLYSYILYAVIPSLYSRSILLRPSSRAVRPVQRIYELISSRVDLPITVTMVSQRSFAARLPEAEVIVFTGTQERAQSIADQLAPEQLFLFFGSGFNPLVIGPAADLDLALRGTLRARLYNSGQDCLCPDVIFVAESICDRFVAQLLEELAQVQLHTERGSKGAEVVPLYYDDILPRVIPYLEQWREHIVAGGSVDPQKRLMTPTVLVSPLGQHPKEVELFAPIFNIVRYRAVEDVYALLTADHGIEHAMYLCNYGELGLTRELEPPYLLCYNEIPLDVEDGNRPFGGYGTWAGFVQSAGRRIGRPLLISAEVTNWQRERKRRQ